MTNLDRALEHRSTSVAADEPLCIATLTGISVEEVLKAGYDVEVRMAKVWRLIANKYGKLPQGILSLAYSRLTVKGFQWAPRTLLREISDKIWDTRPARWMSQKFGILSKQGFELTNPGCIVKRRVWHENCVNPLLDAQGHINHGSLILLRDHNCAWLTVGASERVQPFNEDSGSEAPPLPPKFPSQGRWALLLAGEQYPSDSKTS